MTKFDYYKCDECGKELENTECSPNQLMFTLHTNYDTSVSLGYSNKGNIAHFCGKECLKKYIEKVENHEDLPTIDKIEDNREVKQ